MKKFLFFLPVFLSMAAGGCTRNEESFETSSRTTHVPTEAIPIQEALSDLRQQLGAMRNSTRSAAFDAETIAVLRRSDFGAATRSDAAEGGDSLAYIVNFANGGYAILGADPHLPSVVAIVGKGEMTPEKLVAAKRNVDSGEQVDTPTYVDALVANYILRSADDPTPAARISGDWVIKEHQPSFVKTKWGQGSTKFDTDSLYNKYCINDAGQLCKAGCVAIAMTQILLHNHKTFGKGPRSITGMPLDWTKLDAAAGYEDLADAPADIQDHAARFIHEVGLAVDMDYGIYESISGKNFVLAFMKSQAMNRIYTNPQIVKVPCSYYEDYPYDTDPILKMPMTEYADRYIRPMICYQKIPIFMEGSDGWYEQPGGHAWLIDGWMRKTRSAAPAGEEYIADYVYCNYGWNGDGDGLYAFGTFKNNYNYYNNIINYRLY